ncbi:uroporphyrinogen-III synthase [Novosphingobium guangzhouense]|uniref:Uroporphyrinogen III synthase n=1 Tax=Novosphingobium guangzhouense TaxID=1850347 RepID=A0A2K2FZT4_9SPHN|nr:uroporphyrinogen-III synthase [Novosphingobium guangzhouense]PNU04272.1 uroporphyrinogen III synthase [Novosphingobium guangzhouense]
MILILRPEPGAASTLAAAQAGGLKALVFPLFAVRPTLWQPVARNDIDALLLGSANALRHGGTALAGYRGLPAYCVGETTAAAARAAGMEVAATGHGGLQNLLGVLQPGHSRLLRLAGRERTMLDPPARVTITTREVYASEALPVPAGLIEALRAPAPQPVPAAVIALLHSGEAAARFAQICDEAAIARGSIRLAAIGPRVAAHAGAGWAAVRSARRPDDAALLALAQQMCQEAAYGH